MRPKPVMGPIVVLILSAVLMFTLESSGGLKPEHQNWLSRSRAPDALYEATVYDLIMKQTADHSIRWYYSKTKEEQKGVALVIHGLNLRPNRMKSIISTLTDSGIDVLRLSLRGHGQNYTSSKGVDDDRARLEAFKSVSYQVWMNEAYLAYLKLKERGEEKGVPLYLAAFSLGGLIGLDLFAAYEDIIFDRLILFAPAIRLHAKIYLERVLSHFPRLVIPSMAHKKYLANEAGTPIAAYNALFDSLKQFNKNAGPKLNVPTLVFIDEQDEFIPLGKLKKLVREKKWDQWQFYTVEKEETVVQEKTFYHHIIDASSTGENVWKDMMKSVVKHLLD